MGKMVGGKLVGGIMSRARCAHAIGGRPLAAATRKFRHECGAVPLEVSLLITFKIQNNQNQDEPDYNQHVLADDEIDWDKLVLPEPHMSTRATQRGPGTSEPSSQPGPSSSALTAPFMVTASRAPSPTRRTRSRTAQNKNSHTAKPNARSGENDDTAQALTHTPRPANGRKRQSAGEKGVRGKPKRKK